MGKTGLHLACGKGHGLIVEKLLEWGADTNKREKRKGRTPVHFAVMGGYVELVKMMEAKGGDLFLTDTRGNNSLHLAGKYARIEMMKYLLEKGINPNGRNRAGMLPFDVVMSVPVSNLDKFGALQVRVLFWFVLVWFGLFFFVFRFWKRTGECYQGPSLKKNTICKVLKIIVI
jgi:ankyrin repeat protein